MTDSSEGYIDVRIVLGRDDDPVAHPYIERVERVDYRLPPGTTRDLIDFTVITFWEDYKEFIPEIATAFQNFPDEAFDD